MLKNEQVHRCDRLLTFDLVANLEELSNVTGTIVDTGDFYENVYNVFDALLLITKITQ